MVFANPVVRSTLEPGRHRSRDALLTGLLLGILATPGLSLAQATGEPRAVPRLGIDPGEPQVRSAPPSLPFGVPPATSKEYVLDFHGYLLLPMRLGLHRREQGTRAPGRGRTVLHTPPLIPQDYRRFQYTGVVPDPWVQLNFTYGNSNVAATAILAANTATEAEAVYDPAKQLGVSDAYVTFNLSETLGTPFQFRAGATGNRYGAMGAFDAGRYATPLIARVNAVGETATTTVTTGNATIVVEQGIGGQLGRAPSGLVSSGWNGFADPNAGASFVAHLHAGIDYARHLQAGLHYVHAFSQDDQNLAGNLSDGRISILGADVRLTGRYGHLYVGAAYTKGTDAQFVSGIVEVLNARGGTGLTSEYWGPKSGGNGSLTTIGAQYDVSLSRFVFGEQYRGKNPDVLVSLFGIGTAVRSDDDDYDRKLKLKVGGEATYNLLSWFGTSGRIDHVRTDNDLNSKSFNIYTGRLLFHTNWLSRDEFALQYSHFAYGKNVAVASGYPPVDNPALNPDRHVLSLSVSFWW
jgi:hypothetical protein